MAGEEEKLLLSADKTEFAKAKTSLHCEQHASHLIHCKIKRASNLKQNQEHVPEQLLIDTHAPIHQLQNRI